MINDPLGTLSEWYESHCNGTWEHEWRIRISTLDNPGWSFSVNLEATFEKPIVFERVEAERSSEDWYHCWLEGQVFHAAAGPLNIPDVIECFLSWIADYESNESPEWS